MVSFNAVVLTVLGMHLKFEKQRTFLGKFPPYEGSKCGGKIPNF